MNACFVGVPKERKSQEGRVGMTPAGVSKVKEVGGDVFVEKDAGVLSGFSDKDYLNAGAIVVTEDWEAWGGMDIVVKVKEPILTEYRHLLSMHGKTLFTYLHLAGSEIDLTRALLKNNVTAIAYETVAEEICGRMTFPLLVPMSKIAGTQAMSAALQRHSPEKWKKLGIFIIGGGNVGEAALCRALGSGVEHVVVFESYGPRVQELRLKYKDASVDIFPMTLLHEPIVRMLLPMVDIFICAPMLPGGKEAPVVLAQNDFRIMKQGAYISDVSIDQGGSTAWTKGNPTKPGETFTKGARNLVFSAVPNIPGSTVPREATLALCKATEPYLVGMVANHVASHNGAHVALQSSLSLRLGLQTYRGQLTNEHVALKHGLTHEYRPLDGLF